MFNKIKTALDADSSSQQPTCSAWLQGGGITGSAIIQTLLIGSDPAHPTNNFGHGVFNTTTIAAVTGIQNRDGSFIGVPNNFAITVNDIGAFFNAGDNDGHSYFVGKREYSGNTLRAQATILIHELAHVLSASGFQADAGIPKAGKATDGLVDKNCRNLIEGLQ